MIVAYPLGVSATLVPDTPDPYPMETDMSATRTYTVTGMTCQHCVASVREEVSQLPGVDAVEVDLASGRLAVTGDAVDDGAVRAAVAEAGYQVAP